MNIANFKNLTLRLIKNELIGGSFYLFLGSFFASLFGFLVNLFLARNLEPSDYAIYASLLSLLTLVTIPASSLATIIIKFAGSYIARDEEDKARALFARMTLYFIAIGICIFGVFALFSPAISGFLKIENSLYVILIGLVIAFSYIAIVNAAYIQSLFKFLFISASLAIGSSVRLLTAIVLVFSGFGLWGGLWAMAVSYILPYILSFIPLKRFFKGQRSKVKINLREIGSYAIPTSVSLIFLSSFISTDVILVKHFMAPHEAGLYAGISLVGKVIFYFTGPIPMALFPILVKRHARNESYTRLFYLAVFLISLPSAAIAAFYFIFPEFVISLFLGGGDYLDVAGYLGFFGIFVALYNISYVFVNFFLSIHKTRVFLPVGTASLLQIFLINLYHESVRQVLTVSTISIGLLLASLLLYYTVIKAKS